MTVSSDLAGPPTPGTLIPALLRGALSDWGLGNVSLLPVWQNSAGGLTYSVHLSGEQSLAEFYVKWNPPGSSESLSNEAERLTWLRGRHPAPEVAGLVNLEGAEVLLTRALPGKSAVDSAWQEDPDIALRELGHGLRTLHSVAIAECPFTWSVDQRMRLAQLSHAEVGEPLPIDELVLCQGDPCAPNTLLDRGGAFLAHVDLARMGVADRWADLAVMTMSFAWNFKGYDESVFWEAYGIQPDQERIGFYRRLWNAE